MLHQILHPQTTNQWFDRSARSFEEQEFNRRPVRHLFTYDQDSGWTLNPNWVLEYPECARKYTKPWTWHHNGVKTWNIDKKRALEHRHLRWNIDTIDQPPRVHRQILRWNSDTTFWNKHRCRCSSAKLSMFPREIVDVPAHKTSMF